MSRTDFANRVRAARRYAKLTQKQLAPLVGMSQSNLSELETVAHGSSMTAQIAATCGVDATWLATGEGEMLSYRAAMQTTVQPHRAEEPPPPTLGHALRIVLRAWATLPPSRLAMIRAAVESLAGHPELCDDVANDILPLMLERTTRAPAP
jgi:transcriptional regulator with XRE-family HTH domain